MIRQALGKLFSAHYIVETGSTKVGPAIDVRLKVMGLRLPVGKRTFARVASRYVDQLPSWREPAAAARPALLQGGLAAARRRWFDRQRQMAPTAARSLSTPVTSERPRAVPMRRAVTVSHLFAYDSAPSTSWAARCDKMALLGTFADAPEVQAAAHLFDSRIRVFTQQQDGSLRASFVANPGGRRRPLDLVLQHGHYRFAPGGLAGDQVRLIEKYGMADPRICDVPGDGNCLFHCIASGLGHAPTRHEAVRAIVVLALRRWENAPLDGDGGLSLGQGYPVAT